MNERIIKKIETILDNRLEAGNGLEGNRKEIENVKIWLCCEWQAGEFKTEEYLQLKDMVDSIANRKIKEL